MRIVTDFERFEREWDGGSSVYARTFREFRRALRDADVAVVNCNVSLVLSLAAYFLIAPWRRKPIVAVDLVLRKPVTWTGRIAAWIKKALLSRVEYFIHYFTNLEGYARYYGITPERSGYVGFKPNIRYRYEPREDQPEGDYVLCFGRSQRDYDSFLAAMETLPYPAVIPRPDFAVLREHYSRFTRPLDRLPANVKVAEDDGSQEAMIRQIGGAKIVALPILSATIAASGISVYLNAMLLRKPVVISAGPGVSELLRDEALMVPPEDPMALAEGIRKLWEDDALRRRIAEAGRIYAEGLGGEPELRRRIIEVLGKWQRSRGV